ncbi:MAG TPA: NAD(P)/FAD-dependent oxidoreductase [Syntrophales bacterium]|nr:NAD(P)/FAD-dependent oxidoreductase [Syntrophales bacterium]
MADYDVIVVGGGHNGLTAAGYMAKSGLKTLVVEQRHIVGGACVCEEIEPGFKFHLGATGIAAWLRPEVVRDLELESLGLELVNQNPMYTTPFPDGKYLSIYSNLDDAHREIMRFSKKDADSYVEFFKKWNIFKSFLDPALMNPPLSFINIVNAVSVSPEMLDMLLKGMFFGTLKKMLDDTFESEYVKTAIMGTSLDTSSFGPSATGLSSFIFHFIMTPSWRAVKGGIGNVTQTMARAVEKYGGKIKTGAKVQSIMVKKGKAVGIKLATGEEITASVVVSNANPYVTFMELVGIEHLSDKFAQSIASIRYEGEGMTLNLALSELPDFNFPHERLTGSIMTCPSWQDAEKAWCAYTIHEIPDSFVTLGYLPSYYDDTVAPPGKHLLSTFVYPLSYELAKGSWDERKEEVFDKIINDLAKYVPNLKKSIITRYGWTPLDRERNISLTGGDACHGRMTWDRMFSFRPVSGFSDYRMPIDGLYLCGSGTHPGGGVSGASGHNAAKVVLGDWERGK